MNAADYDDLAIEERWCTEARSDVTNYLTREGVAHGQLGAALLEDERNFIDHSKSSAFIVEEVEF